MTSQAMTIIQKARAQMLGEFVFYASFLMATDMQSLSTIPTAMTDMVKIYYNISFIESLTTDVVKFVLAHEVLHIMLMHGTRCGGRDRRLWNIACDLKINYILKKAGFTLWDKCWYNPKYDEDWSTEQIYNDIANDPAYGAGEGKGLADDLMEVPVSQEEIAELERVVRGRIANAATTARLAGQMPGYLERLVDGILSPPLPWQDLLLQFATAALKTEENWSKRNRRYSQVYLPAMVGERMEELVVIGDTSGSLYESDVYGKLATQLSYIASVVRPERIRVIWADDTDCGLEELFEDVSEFRLNPVGGGGTDMRKPLRWVEQFDPSVVVLVTDCLTPWPDVEPPYPLITVSVIKNQACPWGTTIWME